MKKDHFEILLEEMRSSFQLAFEGHDGLNGRLEKIEGLVGNIEGRLAKLEVGQEVIKTDVRVIKRNTGLLNSIANDHETRIQGVENNLKDHIADHS